MSALYRAAVAVALLAVVACRLDQLVRPPAPPRLVVSPPIVADSTMVGGGKVTRTLAIEADGVDTARWHANTTSGGTWLTLQQTTASAPGTLGVSLNAGGLAAGTYRDTVVVTPEGWDDSAVRIPVTFIVRQSPIVLVFTTQPADTRAATAMTPAVQVTARDPAGKTVTSFSGNAVMTIAANPAGGTLSGTTTVAFSGGVARFSNLKIDRAGSGYTLQATAGALWVTSNSFNVTPRLLSPTQSTVTASVPSITASDGSAVATVTVTAKDADGAPMPGVPVALSSSGGDNRLVPASGVTDDAGIFLAAFSSTRAELKAIYAAAAGTTIQSPASVRVGAAAATNALFSVQPSAVAANRNITPAVAVTVRDAYGNTAEGFSDNVVINLGNDGSSSKGAKLHGNQTVKAVRGVATFTDLRIDRTGNGYTLTAKASALPLVTSIPFNVTVL